MHACHLSGKVPVIYTYSLANQGFSSEWGWKWSVQRHNVAACLLAAILRYLWSNTTRRDLVSDWSFILLTWKSCSTLGQVFRFNQAGNVMFLRKRDRGSANYDFKLGIEVVLFVFWEQCAHNLNKCSQAHSKSLYGRHARRPSFYQVVTLSYKA